jgi:hypothetical protein
MSASNHPGRSKFPCLFQQAEGHAELCQQAFGGSKIYRGAEYLGVMVGWRPSSSPSGYPLHIMLDSGMEVPARGLRHEKP